LERLEALESRIRGLVELVQQLKKENAELHSQLRATRERIHKQDRLNQRWEDERTDIKARLAKAMNELDLLEGIGESKEVALD
jgi:predicted RNase H-like nuclease (RuvC/YqgF family)